MSRRVRRRIPEGSSALCIRRTSACRNHVLAGNNLAEDLIGRAKYHEYFVVVYAAREIVEMIGPRSLQTVRRKQEQNTEERHLIEIVGLYLLKSFGVYDIFSFILWGEHVQS